MIDDTVWVRNAESQDATISLGKSNLNASESHYPLAYGSATAIDVDPTPHRWAYLIGIGPKTVGEVPIVLTMSNHTGVHRKVKVIASAVSHEDKEIEDVFSPQEGIWEVAPEGIHWAHGSLSIPLHAPGEIRVAVVGSRSGNREDSSASAGIDRRGRRRISRVGPLVLHERKNRKFDNSESFGK